MQVRRWQFSIAAALIFSLGSLSAPEAWAQTRPAAALAEIAAPEPITWTATSAQINAYMQIQANRLAAASDLDAVRIRKEVVSIPLPAKDKPGNPSATFVQNYGNAASQHFGKLVKTGTSVTALNAIILIAELKNSDTDIVLQQSLQSTNPAIRLWAARGLNDIWDGLKAISFAYNRDVEALVTALKAENSALVRAEIVRSLVHSGHPSATAPVLAALTQTAASLKTNIPNVANLVAASSILESAAELPATAFAKPNDLPTAQAVADIMSFSGQTLLTLKEEDPKLPGYKSAVVEILHNGGKLLNLSAGKTVVDITKFKATDKSADILGEVFDVTGSENQPGKLQTVYPTLAVPAKVGK